MRIKRKKETIKREKETIKRENETIEREEPKVPIESEILRDLEFEEYGQAEKFYEYSRAEEFDEYRRAEQFDEYGRATEFDEYGRAKEFDEYRRAEQFDEYRRAEQFDEYRRAGEEHTWISIDDFLLIERLIFLSEKVTSTITEEILSQILFLSSEEDDDIFLYIINSPGGAVLPGLAIYETMRAVIPDVITLVVGFAKSTASLILIGGTNRVAYPNARVNIYQPRTADPSADPNILRLEAEEMFELRNTIGEIYAQNTNQCVRRIQQDLERDHYMSATEATDYGIVDDVINGKCFILENPETDDYP